MKFIGETQNHSKKMACKSIFSTISPIPFIKPITKFTTLNSSLLLSTNLPHLCTTQNRVFKLSAAASSSFPYPAPINVDYLATEFGGHGVTFDTIGDSCVIKLRVENGSVASVMLPSGLVTSYKPLMWHGGLVELLHTSVSEGEGGGAVIEGGISLAFKFEGEYSGDSWSPSSWVLGDVRGTPEESIQVELISRNSENKVEVKHILTLEQDLISSEFVIKNSESSSIRFLGSIIGHLAVSTPEATYATGLERSNYFIRPPFSSNFSLIPPDFDKNDSDSSMGFMEVLSIWGGTRYLNDAGDTDISEEEKEGEEDDDYKHLTTKMSRIYTCAPRSFTIIDRGKRNSVVVGREGFEELYMFSPGSNHASYGKYSYISVGQAALLEPIVLNPGVQWRGLQYLHNPNL